MPDCIPTVRTCCLDLAVIPSQPVPLGFMGIGTRPIILEEHCEWPGPMSTGTDRSLRIATSIVILPPGATSDADSITVIDRPLSVAMRGTGVA